MRNFRLKIAITSFLLLLGGFFAMSWPLPPARADQEPVTIRVGSYDNKPKIWMDEKGVAQGIFPDVLDTIAKKEGWKLEYVQGTWDEGLQRLEANEIDIMPDVAVSDERRQVYDFNEETVLVNWGILYSRKDINIESILDLEGKRIAILTTGIHYNGPSGLKNLLDSFGVKAGIVDVQEYADVFKLLDEKQADVGVVNRTFGIANENNYAVKRTNIIFNPTELRFALTKGAEKNNYLIGRIDDDLRRLKSDNNSTYHKSLARHLGGLIERVEVIPRWFRYLALGLIILFAVVLGYILILRGMRRRLESLVEVRTADLEKEKESFRSIFEGSNDPIVLLDASSLLIIECNNAAWRTFGYSKKGSLIGKSLFDFSAPIQPGGQPSSEAMADHHAEVFEKGKSYFEWTCRHVDGTDIFTTVMLTPLDWGGKKVIHVALRDVTEQKSAQEKVLSLDRLKSRFITILTHATRTPLSRLRWSLESLDSGKFEALTPEGRALIRQALDSKDEILRVMTNMNLTLDIERGVLTLERLPASLGSLVSSVANYFRGLPECQDVVCRTDIPGEKLLVDMDSEKLRQVIYGLMDNARRFLTGGKRAVAVRIQRLDGRVRCSIADTGIGIPAAEQKHVFERFFRASNASLKHPDGMGLELYIAKAVIEKHGGVMGFESEEGRGSTFWFELPLVE